LRGQLPIPLLGINSDNDSAFINDSVITYCSEQKIAFTRSRPYCKNDQAWIEQKNGAVIRRFVGHSRYSGAVAGQTLANLYGNLRLYVNFFQPSFKLLSKHRERGKVKKSYAKPETPCDRLLADLRVESRDKEALLQKRAELDPMVLLHQIRLAQSKGGGDALTSLLECQGFGPWVSATSSPIIGVCRFIMGGFLTGISDFPRRADDDHDWSSRFRRRAASDRWHRWRLGSSLGAGRL
jgi:hypothetical protein